MPLPVQPTLCALSFLFLPLMLVSCLNTYQQWHHGLWCQLLSNTFPSVREGGRKGPRYKKWVVIVCFLLSWQRLGACPLTLTAAQTHTGLHLASVETGRQPLRRLWQRNTKNQCSPIDEQLEKRRSRLWASGSGGRKKCHISSLNIKKYDYDVNCAPYRKRMLKALFLSVTLYNN